MTIAHDPAPFAHGSVQVHRSRRGTTFARLFDAQSPSYPEGIVRRSATIGSSGVALDFLALGPEVSVEVRSRSVLQTVLKGQKLLPVLRFLNDARKTLNQAVEETGERVKPDFSEAFDVYVDGRALAPIPVLGRQTLRIAVPADGRRHRVTVYLPNLRACAVVAIHADADLEPVAPRPRLYAFGDSITEGPSGGSSSGYIVQFARRFDLDLLNQGVSGYPYKAASLTGVETLPRPDLVTVAFGTNDWGHGRDTAEQIRENIRAYHRRLHELFPEVPTFVITPLWRGDQERTDRLGGPFAGIAEMIRDAVSGYSNVHVIDGQELVPHELSFYSDGLHPNAAGCRRMASELSSRVAPLLPWTLEAAGEE